MHTSTNGHHELIPTSTVVASKDNVSKIYTCLVHNFDCEQDYNIVIGLQGLDNAEETIKDVELT